MYCERPALELMVTPTRTRAKFDSVSLTMEENLSSQSMAGVNLSVASTILCSRLTVGKTTKELGLLLSVFASSKFQIAWALVTTLRLSEWFPSNCGTPDTSHPRKPRGGPSGGRKFRADTKVKSSSNYLPLFGGSMKYAGIFLGHKKKTEGFFLGCEKRTKGFFFGGGGGC